MSGRSVFFRYFVPLFFIFPFCFLIFHKILNAKENSLIIVGKDAIYAHFKEAAHLLGVIRPKHIASDAVAVAEIYHLLGIRLILDKLNLIEKKRKLVAPLWMRTYLFL